MIACCSVVVFVLLLDQVSKLAVLGAMEPGESVTVLGRVLSLTLVFNPGAAFGILSGHPWLFVPIAVVSSVLIVALISLRSTLLRSVEMMALCFILGGTMGNLIDRIRFGYVVDFFDLHFWPVFNIADSFITIGAVLLGISLFFFKGYAAGKGE